MCIRPIVAPVLIATEAPATVVGRVMLHDDRLLHPLCTNAAGIADTLGHVLASTQGTRINATTWSAGRYYPTPTIIEAATALYAGHSVADLSRSDAGATNLGRTSQVISQAIQAARVSCKKVICFVTGVPGAGKTLVGLNIATEHMDKASELYSVFLSGNGPLVSVLREALARDRVRRECVQGRKLKKGTATSEVKAFIQNVHHFRDECLVDAARPPVEHVALFDEAQRAWNLEQTAKFMRQKKKLSGFQQSEPEFLISCMDRHPDWAVVVCLVGGGQEINTGEAGIGEWIDRWKHIHKADRKSYQKNAYRVLLTRARQGMVVVVPDGDPADPTRRTEFYDPTFEYLQRIGFPTI
jgi:hypothetical protein